VISRVKEDGGGGVMVIVRELRALSIPAPKIISHWCARAKDLTCGGLPNGECEKGILA
jgi:hypothetical protein